MRRIVSTAVLLLILLCPAAAAQHFHHAVESTPDDGGRLSPCTKAVRPPFVRPELKLGLQVVQWKVTHATEDAQKFFNQGMTQYYGFNFEEALHNFLAAADANGPSREMAMASWGIALASGPNINLAMGGPCRTLAQQQSARAVELAAIQHVTPLERQLIEALPLRYNNAADPAAEAVAWSVAMSRVWEKSNNDPNVGALYAESMLDLRPWAVYDGCKRPALDTDRLRKVLLDAMGDGKARETIGAQHLWIHTVEASDKPGEALASAKRLKTWGAALGHLSHMPSHIDLLLGDYKSAAEANETAFNVDWGQFHAACDGLYKKYSLNNACPQLYFGHYVCHNLYFRTVALAFLGQRREALPASVLARGHAMRFVANEPGLQRYMAAVPMTLVMNRQWDTILDDEVEKIEPPEDCYSEPFKPTGCRIIRSIWHWARGMARAAKNDVKSAREEYAGMASEMGKITETGPAGWGNNSALAVLAIPRSLLKARISWADGQYEEAVAHLKLAVTHEDALVYDEPPQWFAPARESLGGAYLQLGDCAAAESTFDADLGRHTESGRALYGLMRALKRNGKAYDNAETRFVKAWKHADQDYGLNENVLWPPRKAGDRTVIQKPCPPMPEP